MIDEIVRFVRGRDLIRESGRKGKAMNQHRTWVKFTGRGHRANCSDCHWMGTHHTMDRLMAQGRPMNVAWYQTKELAKQDINDHQRKERNA